MVATPSQNQEFKQLLLLFDHTFITPNDVSPEKGMSPDDGANRQEITHYTTATFSLASIILLMITVGTVLVVLVNP